MEPKPDNRTEISLGKLISVLDELAKILNEGCETRGQLREFSDTIRRRHDELQRLMLHQAILLGEERKNSTEENPES